MRGTGSLCDQEASGGGRHPYTALRRGLAVRAQRHPGGGVDKRRDAADAEVLVVHLAGLHGPGEGRLGRLDHGQDPRPAGVVAERWDRQQQPATPAAGFRGSQLGFRGRQQRFRGSQPDFREARDETEGAAPTKALRAYRQCRGSFSRERCPH